MNEQELKDVLHANPAAGTFTPYCYHSREANALTFYFAGDADYSETLTGDITVYRSLASNAVVGCRIERANALLADLVHYDIAGSEVTLSLLLLAHAGNVGEQERKALKEVAKASNGMSFEFNSAG